MKDQRSHYSKGHIEEGGGDPGSWSDQNASRRRSRGGTQVMERKWGIIPAIRATGERHCSKKFDKGGLT